MENVVPSLSVLLVQAPVILVWLVGLVLSVVFWRRHPRVSLITMIAILGLLTTSILGSLLGMWLPLTFNRSGMPMSQIGMLMGVISIASSLLSAVFWVLLVIAIFGWRRKPEAP